VNAPDVWVVLSAQPFPFLHELAPVERDCFVLLDAYLRDCLEEWCESGGQLSAHSIVLLDDCARSITRRFRFLDGEGQYYFGQFRRLARRILRRVDVNEAHRQVEREMAVLLDEEYCFDEPFLVLVAGNE
jgi:hypothetical protein